MSPVIKKPLLPARLLVILRREDDWTFDLHIARLYGTDDQGVIHASNTIEPLTKRTVNGKSGYRARGFAGSQRDESPCSPPAPRTTEKRIRPCHGLDAF